MSWARLLKRVFNIDIGHCPNCGGTLKIIACPEHRRTAPLIDKILSHLGLRPGARCAQSAVLRRPQLCGEI